MIDYSSIETVIADIEDYLQKREQETTDEERHARDVVRMKHIQSVIDKEELVSSVMRKKVK